jgi:excisionase family DNA binding protein
MTREFDARFAVALLMPAEVAAKLGVTVGHLRRLAKATRLPGQRVSKGGQMRFQDCAALQRYIENRPFKKRGSLARTRVKSLPPIRVGRDGKVPPHLFVYRKLLHRLGQWQIAYLANNEGRLTPEQCQQVLDEFAPVTEFIEQLKTITCRMPSESRSTHQL